MPKIVASHEAYGGMHYRFHCPGCHCTHFFVVGGGRGWTWNGDAENPTVNPSILTENVEHYPATRCHSFIRDGKIQFLGDCQHELAGQTVELQEAD